MPTAECLQRTGKRPLGSRWVDVNKGDRTNPDVRSRLVAREIAYHRNDDFYAATPPLEALRMLLSIVASAPEDARSWSWMRTRRTPCTPQWTG